MRPDLLIRRESQRPLIRVTGTLDADSAVVFGDATTRDIVLLAGPQRPIELDLDDLELDDSAALVTVLNALRQLLPQGPLVVRHAPQLLAHALYKAGMLLDGRLTLRDPREQEAYTP
jgi:hypothetical protein